MLCHSLSNSESGGRRRSERLQKAPPKSFAENYGSSSEDIEMTPETSVSKKHNGTYKERLDKMREKYGDSYVELYKVKESERQKQFRNSLVGERLSRYNEKAKLRQRRYQQRLKLKQKRKTRASAEVIQAEVEEKRRYWREKQRISRARKRAVSENNGDDLDPTSTFQSLNSKRQAVHRVNKGLPGSREKWAEVMSSIIQDATPRKKLKLATRGIKTDETESENLKIKSKIEEMNEDCKTKRDRYSIYKRRILSEIMTCVSQDSTTSSVLNDSVSSAATTTASNGELHTVSPHIKKHALITASAPNVRI